MKFVGKLMLLCLTIAGAVLLLRHGQNALSPPLPHDMPSQARFVQRGYDNTHNEPLGEWVACNQDGGRQADFCRVTDVHGVVVYQGDFLPLATPRPLPNSELTLDVTRNARMWVKGRADSGPVPVIALQNGTLLVPIREREALINRWITAPGDFETVASGQ